MGFSEAMVGLVLIIIVLAVFIPVTGQLLPTMINDMGAGVGVMVSSVVIVIFACALFIFMRQSMNRDNSMQVN